MRKITIVSIIFVVLAAGAGSLYYIADTFTYTRRIDLPSHLLASSTDSNASTSTPVRNAFGLTDLSVLDPASSTVSVVGWKTYSNAEVGFSLSYPPNLTIKPDLSGSFTLIAPKEAYFHWPLLDDVAISVVASSSCPVFRSGFVDEHPVTVFDNSYTFIRSESADAAAGSVYRELAYDTVHEGLCYRISLFVRGANGAGLYVSDQALISRYETQHQADIDRILKVFVGIVHSFRILE